MKKLMTAMAAIALAGVVQAATVNWESTGYLWDTKNNTKATSLTGGSIVLALVTTVEETTTYTDLSVGSLVTSGMAAAVGKVKGTYSFTYGAEGSVSNGDILTVLFKDEKGKYYQLEYVDTTKGKVTDTYTVTGLSGDDSVLSVFTYASEGNFTAVPEPTSGLLMLLGMAGLALRRKQK